MRPMSVRNTSEEPDTVRTDSATDARPDRLAGLSAAEPLAHQRVRREVLRRAARRSQLLPLEGAGGLGDGDRPHGDEHAQHDEHLEQEELPGQRMPCRGEVRGATPRGSHWSAPM